MRQLILELLPERAPSLDNFVPGGNEESLAVFSEWLAGIRPETAFTLWGQPGCGRTHLLIASGFIYLDAEQEPGLSTLSAQHLSEPPTQLPQSLAVDNVDALNAQGQITLFHHFNLLKRHGGQLLTASPSPPAHLELREDLRTRLGSGLIYRLHGLSDNEKTAALTEQARARGMKMSPEAIDYLLRHAPRDMRTLSALIIALDRHTLEYKRPVTLPLLRELLTENLPLDLN